MGQETVVNIDIAQEKFSASGLMIIARNYLDVYPYDRWSTKVRVFVCWCSSKGFAKKGGKLNEDREMCRIYSNLINLLCVCQVIPVYEQGTQFQPSAIEMVDGQTSPPQLLTEADLISLMEKHGIGKFKTHTGDCVFNVCEVPTTHKYLSMNIL